MFSKFRCSFLSNYMKRSCFKCFSSGAYDHDNLKKIKLRKTLASTVLFGGTLLFALWLKKRRRSSAALNEASLLPKNDLYHSNSLFYNFRGFVFPSFVMKNMDAVREFEGREDDIYVVSFPKTGTTWLQEIVYCIVNGLNNNAVSETSIEDRFPHLEFVYPGLTTIKKMAGQRFIKTHLPLSLLPPDVIEKKPKILYIMRNPKDVTVSYYHFVRMLTVSNYVGNFGNFHQDMVNDRVPYGPMWKHYLDAYAVSDMENILLVFYEDLHKDPCGCIKKISQFLGKTLTEEEVEQIAEHCSFGEMSANPNVNYDYWENIGLKNKNETRFMRKGKVGDWRNYFTADLNKEFDVWIAENFKNSSLQFVYEVKCDSV